MDRSFFIHRRAGYNHHVRIIARYILRECAAYFAISLIAFTGILLTLRMLRFAALIVNRGVEASQIGMVFLSIIPTFLEVALPMATLLGVMLAFARLSGDSEVIVLRASGVSIAQLILPVLLFGLLAGGATLVVSSRLRPWGFKTLSATLFDIARSRTTSGLTEGVFNKLGDMTLYAEDINFQSGELKNVLIDDRRVENQRKVITATSGLIVPEEAERTISLYLRKGTIHELQQKGYVITDYVQNSLRMTPDELYESDSTGAKPPREMYLTQLREERSAARTRYHEAKLGLTPSPSPTPEAADLTAGMVTAPTPAPLSTAELKKRYNKLRTELGRRFSMPYAAFILALVAMPLGIHPARAQRTWGVGLSATLGLAVFVVYYALLSIGVALGENGSINPYVGLWIPNIAATVAAVFCLYKVSTEQWESVTQGLERVVTGISRVISERMKTA